MKLFLNISDTYYQIDGVLHEATIVLIADLSIALGPGSTYQNQSTYLSLRLSSFCYLHLIDKFWLIFLFIIQTSVKHT